MKLNHLISSFIHHIIFMCLIVMHHVKMEQYDIFQQHMNTTHYAQKNVLYFYYKNSTLQVKICRLLTVWRKQWMIHTSVALQDMQIYIYMKPVCKWRWGGDVCYKFWLWAIGTICNVLKQVTHAVLPQLSVCQELLQNMFYIPSEEEYLLSNICIKLPGNV